MKRPETILAPIAFIAAVVGLLLLFERASDEVAVAPNNPTSPTGPTGPKLREPLPAAGPDGALHPPRGGGELPPGVSPVHIPPRDARLLPVPEGEPPRAPEPEEPDEPDEPDEPTVWPATPEGIRGALDEATPRIKRCYEQALEQHPELGGKITVEFAVGTVDTAGGVGTVTRAGIGDATIDSTVMDDCLLDAMEGLQFDPPTDGDIEISYPFFFSTE